MLFMSGINTSNVGQQKDASRLAYSYIGEFMEPIGAATGVAKIVLQVVSNKKKPNLEIYHHLINKLGPEYEMASPNGDPPTKNRNHERGIAFYLVNIGGNRAEDVTLNLSGEFDRKDIRRSIRNIGVFSHIIPCIPPGQSIFLMKLDEFDLYDEVFTENTGKLNGFTSKTLKIELTYNGQNSGFNKVFRWFYDWKKRKQYIETYNFIPKLFVGDLPSSEYA